MARHRNGSFVTDLEGERWHIIHEAGTKHTWYYVSNKARVKWHNVKNGHEGLILLDYNFLNRKDARHPTGGYVLVHLLKGKRNVGFALHRLVVTYFCQKRHLFCTQVDHLDDDHLNNLPENLEWVTQSENIQRQYAKKNINYSLFIIH